jgi:hypothetical protein
MYEGRRVHQAAGGQLLHPGADAARPGEPLNAARNLDPRLLPGILGHQQVERRLGE